MRMNLAALFLALAASCCAQDPPDTPVPPELAARRAALRASGVQTPVAIYPVHVLGRANAEVATVLGLVLERSGLSDLTLAEQPFAPAGEWDAVPAEFGAHVRTHATPEGATRYALFAQFLGDPKQGPTEVRFVLVDAAGELLWSDRQTPADRDFKRTAGRDPDPLGCSMLVGERVFALTGWRRVPGGVPNGKFAERFRIASGAPDAAERASMQERVAALRHELAGAKFVVLPTVHAPADDPSAQRLAELVGQELGCATSTVDAALSVAPSPNQQKRLWGLAAALHTWLGEHPIDGDYALVADIGIDAEGNRGYVNFVVVTKTGKVVMAEFFNDQSPAFRRLQPRTVAEAQRLVGDRLRERLR